MTWPVRHSRCELRITVDPFAPPERVRRDYDTVMARRPTNRIEPHPHTGFSFRRDPPWYLALAAGATLGLGVVGHTIALRTPTLRNHALAWTLDAIAIACAARWIFSMIWRMELTGDGRQVQVRESIGAHTLRTHRIDVDDVTAVLVVGDAPRRRVVFAGPRNVELCHVYEEALLDPPSLTPWIAEAAALVAMRTACDTR